MAERIITWLELQNHIYPHDCWVLIEGKVYHVNDFLVEHPGGDDILVRFSGRDSTSTFNNVPHSDYAKSLRDARFVGNIQSSSPPEGYLERIESKKKQKLKKPKKDLVIRQQPISWEEIRLHKSQESCWIVLNSMVHDVTAYLSEHPGGVNKIMQYAGQDATNGFNDAKHSMSAVEISEKYFVGNVAKSYNKLIYVGLIILIAILAVIFI